jgi:hypothetical protein
MSLLYATFPILPLVVSTKSKLFSLPALNLESFSWEIKLQLEKLKPFVVTFLAFKNKQNPSLKNSRSFG